MNNPKVLALIEKLLDKYKLPLVIEPDKHPWTSQYDKESAKVNYAFVRHFKPTTVVEFGTRGGRCTHDILHALRDNEKDFVFKPYEIQNGLRTTAQNNIDAVFGEKVVQIGGDIIKAKDLPKNIDYLFVDNSHDYDTTRWVFEDLLPNNCIDDCLVHFHDLHIAGDFKFEFEIKPETEIEYMNNLNKEGKFPLKKIFWGWEEGKNMSSTWWRYKK